MSTISSSNNGSSSKEIGDQYASQQAEKEKLRAEHETEMERLKRSFAAEQEYTKDRFESTAQSERLQTYDNLRNIKKQNDREARQLQSASNEQIENKKDQYRKEEIRIDTEGRAKVDDIRKKMAAAEEYQRNQAIAADTLTKGQYSRSANAILTEHESKVNQLRDEKMAALEKRQQEHGIALNQIQDHYDGRQAQLLAQHDRVTQEIIAGTDEQIKATTLAQAQRLDAHQTKQTDPFYHTAKIDSDFFEQQDQYVLRIRLPEYERKGFRVQISGQEVQLSGTRSNTEKTEIEQGHSISTNSFQNYSERYSFDSPVDARAMRVIETDYGFEYTIPKFGANHRMRELAIDETTRKTLAKEDFDLSKDIAFKDTLPKPRIASDSGSGTLS